MLTQLTSLKWALVLKTALAVYLISLTLIFAIIFGYAFVLGFQARGAPEVTQIQAFANQVAPWSGRIGLVVLTGLGALWLARRVGNTAPLHGLAVGSVVSVANLLVNRSLSWVTVGVLVAVLGAGWLGGVVGRPRQ